MRENSIKIPIKIEYRKIGEEYLDENLYQRRQIPYASVCKISDRSAKRFKSYRPKIIEIRFFAAICKWTV